MNIKMLFIDEKVIENVHFGYFLCVLLIFLSASLGQSLGRPPDFFLPDFEAFILLLRSAILGVA